MAAVTKKGLPATQKRREVIKVEPARIIEPENQNEAEVPMPEVGYEIEQEAPSSLTPIVSFENPGDWIAGEFVGTRLGIGPNDSNLYDLKTDGNYYCSVWGSTILDTKMQMLNPKPGKTILIQYMGLIPTSKANDAKNFRVAIVREKK